MNSDVKRRLVIFLVVVTVSVMFLLPTVLRDKMPEKWISRPISLGLDLSGGAYLVYEVKVGEALKSRLQSIANSLRNDLRKDKVAVTRARVNEEGQVEITLLSNRSVEDAKRRVETDYRQLSFISESKDGEREKLLFSASKLNSEQVEKEAVDQAVEKLRNRVDQFGVAEPLIQRQGTNRIVLQLPGVTDVEKVKEIVGRVAKLEFRLVPTPGSSARKVGFKMKDESPIELEEDVLMSGDAVESARVDFNQTQVEVSLKLNTEGAQSFKKLTTDNVGRELAIILDGRVYSHPVIREPIGGGTAQISGGFSMEEARQLAIVLRAGALPAPLELIGKNVVGPSLGAESIKKGIMAMILGCGIVFVFMVIYYKKSGAMAVGTLLVNVLLLLAALSALGATLTLPGLAGLALTIGMAVDANVIIFERIRDELRVGTGRDAAVSAGFDKALRGIVDANVTHLLAGSILYLCGTGSIRGFAVTLCLGILSTIFGAVFVARLGFDVFKLKGRGELSI